MEIEIHAIEFKHLMAFILISIWYISLKQAYCIVNMTIIIAAKYQIDMMSRFPAVTKLL